MGKAIIELIPNFVDITGDALSDAILFMIIGGLIG